MSRLKQTTIGGLILLAFAVAMGVLFWQPVPLPGPTPSIPVGIQSVSGLQMESLSITTTGADGSATGSALMTSYVRGTLEAVHIDYSSGVTTTTDLTISQTTPSLNLLVISDSATDAWYYPRVQVHSTTGTGLTYDGTHTVNEPIPAYGPLSAAVGQSTPTQTIAVTLYWRP